MQISKSSLIFLILNVGCAIGNAYKAPVSYSLSFAVGIILGLGMGLKHRLSFIALDLNEKAVRKLDEKSKPIQDVFPPLLEQVNESFVGKYAAKVSRYAQPLFRLFLYVSGYAAVYDQAAAYMGNFAEQRAALIEKLNPIPGKILSLISVSALMANYGYISQPVLSKITILSGFPMGYALGKFLMRNFDWGILQNASYSAAVANAHY